LDLTELVKRCIRIFYISKKPSNEDFTQTATITAIGIVLLGFVGIVIAAIFGVI
jgi:protein translocase SEC61 complex gamma subunit